MCKRAKEAFFRIAHAYTTHCNLVWPIGTHWHGEKGWVVNLTLGCLFLRPPVYANEQRKGVLDIRYLGQHIAACCGPFKLNGIEKKGA